MSDEPTYDWSNAPQEMRAEVQRIQKLAADLQAQAEKDRARLADVDRRERFNELKLAGGDTLKDVALEDIGDLVAEQITPTILQAKALEKAQTQQAALSKLAADAGFTSVEEMQAFRTEADARKAATLQAQGVTAAAATSGQTFNEPIASPHDAAFAAYNDARTKGMPPDDAKGAAVMALLNAASGQK
jgi:hypothetical protein